MRTLPRVFVEAALVAAIAVAVGLAANAVSARGLSLTYVPPVPPAPPPGGDPDPAVAAIDKSKFPGKVAEVARRLAAKGFQVLDHDGAAALFHDEFFQYEAYAFIDARNDKQYREGHIPTAYLFDHYHMEKYVEEVRAVCLSGVMKVIVYCYGEECTDSEIAARHLLDMGVDPETLQIYVGGMAAWKKAGLPVERGERGSGDIVEGTGG